MSHQKRKLVAKLSLSNAPIWISNRKMQFFPTEFRRDSVENDAYTCALILWWLRLHTNYWLPSMGQNGNGRRHGEKKEDRIKNQRKWKSRNEINTLTIKTCDRQKRKNAFTCACMEGNSSASVGWDPTLGECEWVSSFLTVHLNGAVFGWDPDTPPTKG